MIIPRDARSLPFRTWSSSFLFVCFFFFLRWQTNKKKSAHQRGTGETTSDPNEPMKPAKHARDERNKSRRCRDVQRRLQRSTDHTEEATTVGHFTFEFGWNPRTNSDDTTRHATPGGLTKYLSSFFFFRRPPPSNKNRTFGIGIDKRQDLPPVGERWRFFRYGWWWSLHTCFFFCLSIYTLFLCSRVVQYSVHHRRLSPARPSIDASARPWRFLEFFLKFSLRHLRLARKVS